MLNDDAQAAIAHGDFVYRDSSPPIFRSAYGVTLEDQQGHKYLDAEAANGSVGLGYDATILRQATEKVALIPGLPCFLEHSARLRLASRLSNRIAQATGEPGRIAFEVGGAQGIELALKIARRNTGRHGYAVFEGAYHGRSMWTAELSSSHRYREHTGPSGLAVTRLPYPDCESCRFGLERATCDARCGRFVETAVAEDFAGLRGGKESSVAAFIFEPLLNAGGLVLPDSRYVRSAVDAFRRAGSLIIVDEVFTGFHRIGPLWGLLRHGIRPDIVVLSKALGNGLAPVSAIWAREPLLAPQNFPPGTHSTTFANNPLGLAIADTVLDRYDAWTDLDSHVREIERCLREGCDRLRAASSLVRSTNVVGVTARVRLHEPIAARVAGHAMRAGIIHPIRDYSGLVVAFSGVRPDIVGLHPPLVISAIECEVMFDLALRALDAVAEHG